MSARLRGRLGLVAVSALVLMAGCSSDSEQQSVMPTPTTAAPATTLAPGADPNGTVTPLPDNPVTSDVEPPDSVAPPDPGASTPTPVSPSPGTVDPHRTAVDNVVSSPQSDQLEVWFWNGVAPCALLDRVEVTETPTQVTVVVYVGSGTSDQACIDLAQRYSTTVELDAPLGDREVIDGGTR